jgi:phage terminase small subunit
VAKQAPPKARKPSRKQSPKNGITIPDPAPADALSENERAFVLIYEGNGRNATRAYLEIHPGVKVTTAAVEGWKLLRIPKIAAALEEDSKERFARLEMKADEALARISAIARVDVLDAYDDEGKMLPVVGWPENLRRAVKSIKANGDVVLYDALRAAELMAQAGGKLKANALSITFDHAKYLGAEPPEE